ncbi:hypothetical protein [Metasolibacillus fluoroglycofenilyticus]|uniref:hypothetical protein n=1 Tax=Metasolibacillus fluoroglycofenilyticus TaxID=1239396 RepID=UPI001911F63A|nr:hypothetical protein [Metasolibacillus fluoroglycofenilyticus]
MTGKKELQYAPVSNFNIIQEGYTPNSIDTSVATLNQPLADMLNYIGLPTEDVLVPIEERRKVIFALESTLDILPMSERSKAMYLSKFTVAITVGLFDGALNFLWNETINALRNMVNNFDLQYFYSIAGTLNNRYKNLNTFDDFENISDHDLLEICRRIGLLSDINFNRLEHVNYLRNHASSAHPNQNDVTGTEMLSLLEHCLKHAIIAEPDTSVIQIKTLLDNIRKTVIPEEDITVIAQDLLKQPQERINDFILTLYGLYCDERQDDFVKDNIELLAKPIWVGIEDEVKYRIGSKFGLYRKNAQVYKKEATQRFLEIVDGLRYKDEDSLAAELIDKLQTLRSVHYNYNNFYNESIHASSIAESLPKSGIPDSARKLFVKVIVVCYVGNGLGYREGVDEQAVVHYARFIDNFEVKEIKEFLKLFTDPEFVGDFDRGIPNRRLRSLIPKFKTKTTDPHINAVLDFIAQFPSSRLDKVASDHRYQELMKHI